MILGKHCQLRCELLPSLCHRQPCLSFDARPLARSIRLLGCCACVCGYLVSGEVKVTLNLACCAPLPAPDHRLAS